MADRWTVNYTDEFGEWWQGLAVDVQERLYKVVSLLEINGPNLRFPYSSDIRGTSIALRELRAQCGGHPYRVLYAFDPERAAVLLVGGDKTGDDRWYERMVPVAESIYMQYLLELKEVNNDPQV